MSNGQPLPPRERVWILLLILLAAAVLRLVVLSELPVGLHYDEAANVILTGGVSSGASTPLFIEAWNGKEVLFFYWAALWVKLLGTTVVAVRLGAAVLGIATVAATFWAVRELLHGERRADRIALLTAAFVSLSFWHLLFSRSCYRAVAQPLLQALTIAALWRGLRLPFGRTSADGEETSHGRSGPNGLAWLVAAGIFCGLTAYTYLAARAFPLPLGAALVVLLLADRRRRPARLKQSALFIAVAALTVSPLVHYWLTHPGTFTNRMNQVVATSWSSAWSGFLCCLGMFFIRGDPYVRFNIIGRPVFDPVMACLFLAGIAVTVRRLILPSPPLRRSAYALLLVAVPAMLLPSALASNDITPSNLRAIGLLPLVYVFPALALSAIRDLIPQRRAWLAAYGALVALLLLALGCTTAVAYFSDWAPSASLYYRADGDLADTAAYLNEAVLSDTTPFVASLLYQHPTVAHLSPRYDDVRWLTQGRTVVFPAGGKAVLIVPRSACEDLAWVESLLPTDALAAAPDGPDGSPAFYVYGVSAADSPSPPHLLAANLGHIAEVLGYEVVDEPRSGSTADVALWWRVTANPDQSDYAPVARLVDRWGHVWGTAHPFHYTSEQWTPGEIIVDHLTVPVAPGAPPGDYVVRFSLYSTQADRALYVLDADGRYAGTYVELPVHLARAEEAPDAEALGIDTPLNARTGGLVLLGASLETTTVRPGEPLHVTLFWQAADSHLPNCSVALRLGGTGLCAGAPVHDTYPTSAWAAAEVVADRYDPVVPRDAAPGQYPLEVVVDGSAISLGEVAVQATRRLFDVPAISHPVSATLAGQVELLGYDLSAQSAAPGDTLVLTLYWRALAEMNESYTVFTHVIGPDGSMAGQRDGIPVGWTYPTTVWVAGEVITDGYEIQVRPDASPGAHRLEIGMYVADTGARLPVDGSPADAVNLQAITVQRP